MMVLSRNESKKRRKEGNGVLQVNPKRTKVHAQRKFAQGSSSLTSPVITPVKDKTKVNGVSPPADVLPVKRPNTEDFLTFLCFRSTNVLPAKLDFFSSASNIDSQDDDDLEAVNSVSCSSRSQRHVLMLHGKENDQESNSESGGVGQRRSQASTSAQGRAVKALKRKYHEQRLAKHKKKLCVQKGRRHIVHQTRYSTRAALQQNVVKKGTNRVAQATPSTSHATHTVADKAKKPVAAKTAKQLVKPRMKSYDNFVYFTASDIPFNLYMGGRHKNLRVGLRSGGQLPPGSDIGVKCPVRRPRAQQSIQPVVQLTPLKGITVSSNQKYKVKPVAAKVAVELAVSDSSSDDDQPLVKKYKKDQLTPAVLKKEAQAVVTRSKQPQPSSDASGNRPTRKTKEAAAFYMEMLGKDLRSPEECDDDAVSVESFPELPYNKKGCELKDKEKAIVEKNKIEKGMRKKNVSKETAAVKKQMASPVSSTKIDDRAKRMFLRNKLKTKLLKKEAARKLKSRALRKSAALGAKNVEPKLIHYKKGKLKTEPGKKLPEAKDSALIKAPEKITTQKRGRRFDSKAESIESRKSSAASLSPSQQKLRTSRTSSLSSERMLRTKPAQPTEDYTESDEEPLDVLSAKLPKKENALAKEESGSVGKKELKARQTPTSSGSDSRGSTKREKPKNLQQKTENKDVKEESHNIGKVKTVEKVEEIQRKKGESKKVSSLKVDTPVKNLTDDTVKVESKNEKKTDMKLKAKKKKNAKKMRLHSTKSKLARVSSEDNSAVKLDNLDIRIAELRISKAEHADNIKGINKNKNISNKFKDSGSELVIKKPSIVMNSISTTKLVETATLSKLTESKASPVVAIFTPPTEAHSSSSSLLVPSTEEKTDSSDTTLSNKNVTTEHSSKTFVGDVSLSFVDRNKKDCDIVGDSDILETNKVKNANSFNKNEELIAENSTSNVSAKEEKEINAEKGNKSDKNAVVNVTSDEVKCIILSTDIEEKGVEKPINVVRRRLSVDETRSMLVDNVAKLAELKIGSETKRDESKQSGSITENQNNSVEKNKHVDPKNTTTLKSSNAKSDNVSIKTVIEANDKEKVTDKVGDNMSVVKKSSEKVKTPTKFCESKKLDETPVKVVANTIAPTEKHDTLETKKIEKSEKLETVSTVLLEMPKILPKIRTEITDKKPDKTCLEVFPKVEAIGNQPVEIDTTKNVVIEEKGKNSMSINKLDVTPTLSMKKNSWGTDKVLAEEKAKVLKNDKEFNKLPLTSFSSSLPSPMKCPSPLLPVTSGNVVKFEEKCVVKEIKKDVVSVPPNLLKQEKLSDSSSAVLQESNLTKTNNNLPIKNSVADVQNTPVSLGSDKDGKSIEIIFCSKSSKDASKSVFNDNVPLITGASNSFTLKSDSPTKDNNMNLDLKSCTVKSRQSVNDTWRLAFKNAKIPKPGQSSPVMGDGKPFVRKPFTSNTLKKKHLTFESFLSSDDASCGSASSHRATINPFSVSKSTTVLESTKTITTTVIPDDTITSQSSAAKNTVIDPETLRLKEAEVEDFVRKFVGGELEKLHSAASQNVVCTADVNLVSTEQVAQHLNKNQMPEKSMTVVPIVTFTSNSPVVTATSGDTTVLPDRKSNIVLPNMSRPISPMRSLGTHSSCSDSMQVTGKHTHLLPVDQTLKKLGQSKVPVGRRQNVMSVPAGSVKQLEVVTNPQPSSSSSAPVVGTTGFKDKSNESVTSQKSCVTAAEEVNGVQATVLTKKKVNMSTEDINKWLNDSISAGIEHTKNCGIFEKNRCECKPSIYSDATNEPSESINKDEATSDVVVVDKVGQKPVKSVVVSEKKRVVDVVEKLDVTSVTKDGGSDQKVVDATKSRNVNVTLPFPGKVTCDVTPQKQQVKSGSSPVESTGKNAEVVVSKVSPIYDNVCVGSSVNRMKVSRGTNKMGDSENEASSRDPSEVSSPPPRDDVSSTDESPDKFAHPERRSIFHQRRSMFRSKMPAMSRSASAFSPENESSVYAFEPDLPPTSTPFRRLGSKTAISHKESRSTSSQSLNESCSSSIAVQCNLDNEAVLECSTQTDTSDYVEGEGHLFYIPLVRGDAPSAGTNQHMFQGLAFKLGAQGEQKFIMRAKLLTKPPTTFVSSSSSSVVSARDLGTSTISSPIAKPEQKVRPMTVNNSSSTVTRPPVGTVQPTARMPNPPESVSSPPVPALPPTKLNSTPEKVISKTATKESPDEPTKELTPMQTSPEKCDKTDVTTSVSESVSNDEKILCDSTVSTHDMSTRSKHQEEMRLEVAKSTSAVKERTRRLSSPAPVVEKTNASDTTHTAKDSSASASTSTKPKRWKGKGTDAKGAGHEGNIKLKDAPSFHPTEREFLDPLEYIEKIRPAAEKFGICRIIPPANFKPECKVSDDMRFTAYNQYVHKMQHRWGPNVKEMLAIKRYLATQSIALTHPPWIGGMEVDLPRLYQTVQNCGGLKEVIERKRWQRVADAMRIPKSAQDRVTKLDDIYCKFLLPYDTLSHEERTKLFEQVEKEWEKRMESSQAPSTNEAATETSSEDSSNDITELDECIVKGRNMPLNAFYRIARNTMAMYFRSVEQPSAHDVESEFWNHVETRQSHVCVHSGSIDSGSNGYGFPTAKNSSTARHPWNLKVLTNNSGSILRSLGPIMGVTVPTLHVGMLFSACCWYRDPHGLPWIEYLHTGASKIWYSIPDESSSKFRDAVTEVVPDLCRDKTIWLASDTAMIPPSLLVKRKIPICRTVQEPGQFIIVFPKAFTSSICTGYLVSESVYFAQPSWLLTAQRVFKDMSNSSEPSMFSLERLLFSIATDARCHVDVLLQVLPMVLGLRDTEIVNRNELDNLGLTSSERLPLNKRRKSRLAHDDDSDYECETCRANLFLSLVTNTHEEAVYCLSHAIELLKVKPDHLKYCKLLYTYDLDELDELVDKMKNRIEIKSQKKSQSKSNSLLQNASKL